MAFLKRFYSSFFLGSGFYRLLAAVIFIFVISYGVPFLFSVARLLLVIFLIATGFDTWILYSRRNPLTVQRQIPDRLSNGEENMLNWQMVNHYPYPVAVVLRDEFPESWQIRDFQLRRTLKPDEAVNLGYAIRPKERGEFFFGKTYVFIKSPLRLVVRRKAFESDHSVKVFPGFLKLRQFEFMSHITDPGNTGYKQVRKTGHSLEFEQIREYVSGDDIRSINWRATGRTGGQLMINNFTDEKSQQIYCIIDKGRAMKMAFNGVCLLDYAINATLAMCAIAISKQDKAGFISFSDVAGDFLPANGRAVQMSGIMNALYNLNTRFLESDFAFLHKLIKSRITQRSLLILFTNFESVTAMERQLPYLRNIAQKHLLLIVFFENTSLQNIASDHAGNIEQLYEKIIAEKFVLEKKVIVKELQRYGISALLTTPEKLSVDTINTYLQIKARREI